MLTFLYLAANAGFVVDSYDDTAAGRMAKTPAGRVWVAEVVLHPLVRWSAPAPDAATIIALHHAAHDECFIANSVKTEVRIEPA